MNAIYVPLISGLVGAVIGAAASVLTIWVQASIADRRERLRQVTDLALAEHKMRLDHSKSGQRIAPIVVSLHYYSAVLDALEKGEATPEKLLEISESTSEISDALRTQPSQTEGQ